MAGDETNLAVTSPNFTTSSLSPHNYVIGGLKVVTPEKSPQKRKDDVTIESPAKSSCDAKFSPPKPDFYDVTKTDLVPASSLLEFEPYNKNAADSCSELMTSSQDSGVCSKSSNDVIAFADSKPESFRRSEPQRHKEKPEVPAKSFKPEVPAKPRNLLAKKVLVTSQRDQEQRRDFREKLEKMMRRQSNTMTSHTPQLSRRNSSEALRRNGSVTSCSDVSNTPTSERIRQRLRSMPSTSSSNSSAASNENLQEKLGQLLLDGGDHDRNAAPKKPAPQQRVAKQQQPAGKIPDDWRWRVLEHLRHKNVVPPPRNCDVTRSKTPAMTSLSASALPAQMNSMTSLRPKSVTNHNVMTSSAFTRSANDVTSIPQNVKVCFLIFFVPFMFL